MLLERPPHPFRRIGTRHPEPRKKVSRGEEVIGRTRIGCVQQQRPSVGIRNGRTHGGASVKPRMASCLFFFGRHVRHRYLSALDARELVGMDTHNIKRNGRADVAPTSTNLIAGTKEEQAVLDEVHK